MRSTRNISLLYRCIPFKSSVFLTDKKKFGDVSTSGYVAIFGERFAIFAEERQKKIIEIEIPSRLELMTCGLSDVRLSHFAKYAKQRFVGKKDSHL